MNKRMASVLATMALTGGVVTAGAGAAQASPVAGCYVGDACFYYLRAFSGSYVGFPDRYWGDVENPWVDFETSGTGKGLGIGNAAGSEGNADPVNTLAIWVHAYKGGNADVLGPGVGITYTSTSDPYYTINNERSFEFSNY